MNRRTLLAGIAASAAVPTLAFAQPAKARVTFWHAMENVLGEEVNRICAAFNASQGAVEVVPVFKGSYPETLTAAIAAFRGGQAPNLVQMFEVGTGSMLAAGPAVKQTWQLIQETGVAIDTNVYVPAVKGYYSLPDGRLASMPFNSSTPVMWYNKDAFEKAGLDPEKPPVTWDDVAHATAAIKAKSAASIPSTSAWFSWIQLETYAAMHNLAFASKEDGFAGLDAQLECNTAPFVKQVARFLEMSKEGTFKYTGRDGTPDSVFYTGEAAITFGSSGLRGAVLKNAKFKWAEAFLPYDPAIIPKPINSIIGGASLWAMTAPSRTAAEYKGAAEFLKFLAGAQQDATWSQNTGYVPVTFAGYEENKKEGYYAKNPGADIPILQLQRGQVTENSKGLRLGRMPEIRNIIYEEVEKALQGQQDAKAAMDGVVARGNKVLRDFERANKA